MIERILDDISDSSENSMRTFRVQQCDSDSDGDMKTFRVRRCDSDSDAVRKIPF